MKKIPAKIYLQFAPQSDEPLGNFYDGEEVTWCKNRVNPSDVEYVRVVIETNAQLLESKKVWAFTYRDYKGRRMLRAAYKFKGIQSAEIRNGVKGKIWLDVTYSYFRKVSFEYNSIREAKKKLTKIMISEKQ